MDIEGREWPLMEAWEELSDPQTTVRDVSFLPMQVHVELRTDVGKSPVDVSKMFQHLLHRTR